MAENQSEKVEEQSRTAETSVVETPTDVTDVTTALDRANKTVGKKQNEKKEGGKVVKKLSSLMLTQVLEPAFFIDMGDDDHSPLAEAVRSRDTARLADAMAQALADAGHAPCEGYAIVHEGETRRSELDMHLVRDRDESVLDRPKAVHVHAIFRFDRDAAPTLVEASRALRVDRQYVVKPRNQHSWDNWMAYLIHAKSPEKRPYDWHDVANAHVSGDRIGNYSQVYAENSESWAVYKADSTMGRHGCHVMDASLVVKEILDGLLTLKMILLNEALYRVYGSSSDAKKEIDTAWKVVTERNALMNREMRRDDTGQVNISISGPSGVGKTWLAGFLCGLTQRDYGWRRHECAESHITDGYASQEIMFLDEVRPKTFSSLSQLLRLLDPLHSSPLDARYKTVDLHGLRMLLMTGIEPLPDMLHGKFPGIDGTEPMDQVMRRLSLLVYLELRADTVIAKLDWPRYHETGLAYHWPCAAGESENVEMLHYITGRMSGETLPEVPMYRRTGRTSQGLPIMEPIDDPAAAIFNHPSVRPMLERAHTFPTLVSDELTAGGDVR